MVKINGNKMKSNPCKIKSNKTEKIKKMKISVPANLNKSFVLFAALCLSFSSLSWAAQINAPLFLPKAEAATTPSRQSILTMKDIGASRPIELRGVDGNTYLSLGVRLDEVATKARLHLNYTLPFLSMSACQPICLPGK